jgi:phosphate transport system substrate-binding protein
MSTVNSADRPVRGVRAAAVAAVFLAVLGATQLWGELPAGASPNMQSTGSSFAGAAIQEWVGQSNTLFGLNINWQVQSSIIGLNQFATNQVDFGASDIPYSSGQAQSTPNQPYQYMPDVAGGLAFMFNVNGQDGSQITNLNLNATVISKIFFGKITNWNDPAIRALNPSICPSASQCNLPNQPIIPVYRSEPSGENYLLSDYLLHQDPADINAANTDFSTSPLPLPSATWVYPSDLGQVQNTGNYPNLGKFVAQVGSDNAANYVAAAASVGSITYVETAYAINHHMPVASLVNTSGGAVQPSSVNVATALEAAVLHPDLTQDLTNVYTNPLPNAYPLSAYSYLVTACSPSLAASQQVACAGGPTIPSPFPASKGQALGQFVSYLACAGQERMAFLGYSPLPPVLVQADFNAVGRLNGGVQPPPPTAANCKNPYVDGTTVLPGSPVVAGQAGGGVTATTAPVAVPGAAATSGHSGAAGTSSTGAGSGGGASSASSSGAAGSATAGLTPDQIAKGEKVVNGQLVRQPCPSGRFICGSDLLAATKSVIGPSALVYVGWALLFLGILLVPPLIASWIKRRQTGDAETGLA